MYKLMIFVMQSEGHNPNYMQWLAEAWRNSQSDAHLDIVVSPLFVNKHPKLCQAIAHAGSNQIRLISVTSDEVQHSQFAHTSLGSMIQRWPWLVRRTKLRIERFQEWRLCLEYASKLGSDQILFLNFDFYQGVIATGIDLPCRFSGIYHNTSFHYAKMFGQKLGPKGQIKAQVQQAQVKRILHHPSLQMLFFHDPLLAEVILARQPGLHAASLPTPARMENARLGRVEELRQELQIESDRCVFLLLGAVSRRRGLYEVLHALTLLDNHIGQRVCLLLVGRHEQKAALTEAIKNARCSSPTQIISKDEFIPESDIAAYYTLADVILVTHPQHVGTSVSLAYAANAGKPVLASSFGLLGELVRRYRLGVIVDARNPAEIAHGLTRYIEGKIEADYDPLLSAQFAKENSVENFTRVLIDNILPRTSA